MPADASVLSVQERATQDGAVLDAPRFRHFRRGLARRWSVRCQRRWRLVFLSPAARLECGSCAQRLTGVGILYIACGYIERPVGKRVASV